jgi:hypothetical protein
MSDVTSVAASLVNNDTFTVSRAFVVTGNIVNGSAVISNVSNTSRITVGQVVGNGNNGIPSGATVVSSPSGTSVTISALATSTVVGGAISFADPLFTGSTASQSLVAGVPLSLGRVPNTPLDKFIVGPLDSLRVNVGTSVVPPAGTVSGEVDILVETPAASGNWQESLVTLGSETALKFFNAGTQTLTYDFRLPFVVTGGGKPNKLIARLNVDFNCIVTFSVLVGSSVVTLSPVSGTVANTGGLITSEFAIPTLSGGVTWNVGSVAYVNVAITAQAGGSAAFSYIGLTLEDAPYLLFVGTTD